MSSSNPAAINNPQESIQGIILRTSAAISGRYAYLSLPSGSPTAVSSASLDADFDDSISNAPHFPDITILDCISSSILYHTSNSYDFFHVYNLITRIHVHIPFPYPHTFVNAAIVLQERIHFKVLVVCIERQTNPLLDEAWDGNIFNPLLFYVYSSQSENWSRIGDSSSIFPTVQLLANRRKPAHAGEDAVYLDLTKLFLIRFTSLNDQLGQTPKIIAAPWEIESIDETTWYGGCRGCLHCVKFDPINVRYEVYEWTMELPRGFWRLVVTGVQRGVTGTVVGLHPNDVNLVVLRSEGNNNILMVDIRNNFQWVVVGRKVGNGGQLCFLEVVIELLEAALETGDEMFPPPENVVEREGEIFIVSIF